MNVHEIVTIVLCLLCGFYCGLANGYRQANREYRAAIDGAVEAMQRGGETIAWLRQRLVAKRIIELRAKGKSGSQI
jgi:hypothetical protein